ncbi:MAG: hypothetical protein ACERK0_00270, partial [Deltaproteobacteria bacterium]
MNTNTRALFITLAIAGAGGVPAGSGAQEPSIASSVVSLDVVSDVPDLTTPWQTAGIDYFGGSGVIIEGRRILTN